MDDSRITTEESDPAPTLRPLVETGIQEAAALPTPPPTPTRPGFQKDREHLDTLAAFYYIFFALECFGVVLIPLYAVLIYVMLCSGLMPTRPGQQPLPPEFGWILEGVLGVAFLLSALSAVLQWMTARDLQRRKHPTFCLIVACLHCLSVPVGTLLGVFTILVLQRDSVKELFRTGDPAPVPEDTGPVFHPYEQRQKDKQWLGVLSILHFVMGGLMAFFGVLPLIYFVMGVFLLTAPLPPAPPGQPAPPFAVLGGIMIGLGVLLTVLLWGPAIMAIVTGVNLRRRKNWKLCLMGTAVQCISGLFGVALCGLTVFILMRQSVRDLFKYGEPVTTTDEDYA